MAKPDKDKPQTKEDYLNQELRKWNGGPEIKPYDESEEEQDWFDNLDDYHNSGQVPYRSMRNNKDFKF